MSVYVPEGGPTGPMHTEKATVSAKEISKWSMLVASAWIGGLHLLKAFWGMLSKTEFGLTSHEINMSGVFLAGVFSPVYFSIILDKIKGNKHREAM